MVEDDVFKNYIESQKRHREIIESQKRINEEIIKEETKTISLSKEKKSLKENMKELPVKGHSLILIYIDLTGCFSDEKIAIACGYFKINSNGQKIANYKSFNSELIAAHKKYKKYLTVDEDDLVYIYEKFIERNSIEEIAIVCGYFDIKNNGEKIACVDDFMKAYDSAIKESRNISYIFAEYGSSMYINNGILYSHAEIISDPCGWYRVWIPTKEPGPRSGPIRLNRINRDWVKEIDYKVWGYRKPILTLFKDRLCQEDEDHGWTAYIPERTLKEHEEIYRSKNLRIEEALNVDSEEYLDSLGLSEPMMRIYGNDHTFVDYSLNYESPLEPHELFELYGLREKDIAYFDHD